MKRKEKWDQRDQKRKKALDKEKRKSNRKALRLIEGFILGWKERKTKKKKNR